MLENRSWGFFGTDTVHTLQTRHKQTTDGRNTVV